MKKQLLIGFLLLIFQQHAAAECSCLWQGSFSDVQERADLVVNGTVVSGVGNSIDLSVTSVLRGKEPPESIRIWLKAADYCRPEAEGFPPESQWVMALHKITEEVEGGFNPGTPNISYGRVGDYYLSSCGAYWLQREGAWVSGNIVDGPRWDYEPGMSPVLLDLLADYVAGDLDRETLAEASRKNPELRELILDTRTFLRNEN